MPLVQSLDILRQKVPNPTFKAVLDDVYEKVRSGIALSDAFDAHAALFPPIYTASLLAGEKSGNLDRGAAAVHRLHARRRRGEAQHDLGADLSGRAVLAVDLVVCSASWCKVVPAFADFYGSFGAELPLATRVLIGDLRRWCAINLPFLADRRWSAAGVVRLVVAADRAPTSSGCTR